MDALKCGIHSCEDCEECWEQVRQTAGPCYAHAREQCDVCYPSRHGRAVKLKGAPALMPADTSADVTYSIAEDIFQCSAVLLTIAGVLALWWKWVA